MDHIQCEAPLDSSFQKDKLELVNKGSLSQRRKPSRSNLRLLLSPPSNGQDFNLPTPRIVTKELIPNGRCKKLEKPIQRSSKQLETIHSSPPVSPEPPNYVLEAQQFSIESKLKNKPELGRSAVLIQTWERRTLNDSFTKLKPTPRQQVKTKFSNKENQINNLRNSTMPDTSVSSKYTNGCLPNGDGKKNGLVPNVRGFSPDMTMLYTLPEKNQIVNKKINSVSSDNLKGGGEPEWISLSRKLCAKFVEGHLLEDNSNDSVEKEEPNGTVQSSPPVINNKIEETSKLVPTKEKIAEEISINPTNENGKPPWVHLSKKLCTKFIEEHIEYPKTTNPVSKPISEFKEPIIEPNGDIRIIEKIGKPNVPKAKSKKEPQPEWISLSKKLRAKFIETHIGDPDTISLDNQLNTSDLEESNCHSFSDEMVQQIESPKTKIKSIVSKSNGWNTQNNNRSEEKVKNSSKDTKECFKLPEKECCWQYQELDFDEESNSETLPSTEFQDCSISQNIQTSFQGPQLIHATSVAAKSNNRFSSEVPDCSYLQNTQKSFQESQLIHATSVCEKSNNRLSSEFPDCSYPQNIQKSFQESQLIHASISEKSTNRLINGENKEVKKTCENENNVKSNHSLDTHDEQPFQNGRNWISCKGSKCPQNDDKHITVQFITNSKRKQNYPLNEENSKSRSYFELSTWEEAHFGKKPEMNESELEIVELKSFQRKLRSKSLDDIIELEKNRYPLNCENRIQKEIKLKKCPLSSKEKPNSKSNERDKINGQNDVQTTHLNSKKVDIANAYIKCANQNLKNNPSYSKKETHSLSREANCGEESQNVCKKEIYVKHNSETREQNNHVLEQISPNAYKNSNGSFNNEAIELKVSERMSLSRSHETVYKNEYANLPPQKNDVKASHNRPKSTNSIIIKQEFKGNNFKNSESHQYLNHNGYHDTFHSETSQESVSEDIINTSSSNHVTSDIPLCAKLVSNANTSSTSSNSNRIDSPSSESSHVYEDVFKETTSCPSDSETSSWTVMKNNSYYINGRSSSLNDLDASDGSMSMKCEYTSSCSNHSTLQSRRSSCASSSFYVNLRDYDHHMLEPALTKKKKAIASPSSGPPTPESLKHLFTSPLQVNKSLMTRTTSEPQQLNYYNSSSAFKHCYEPVTKPKKPERSSSIKIKDIAQGIILTFRRFQSHKFSHVSPTHVDVSHLAEAGNRKGNWEEKSKKSGNHKQNSKKYKVGKHHKHHGFENGKTDSDSGCPLPSMNVHENNSKHSVSNANASKLHQEMTAVQNIPEKKKSKYGKKSSDSREKGKNRSKTVECRPVPMVSRKVQQMADGTLYLVTTVSGDTAVPGVYSDSPDTSSELSFQRTVKPQGESNC